MGVSGVKKAVAITCALTGMFMPPGLADNPAWSGEGDKPAEAEQHQHQEQIHDNNNDQKTVKLSPTMKEVGRTDESEAEKERRKLEENLRSTHRGMIQHQPMN